MVKKAFWKSNFKTIRKSFNRFLSMFSIVFLSTAVITGLLVTGPNIRSTMTEKYNKQNTYDINLMFPGSDLLEDIAFTSNSINIIKDTNEFLEIEPFNLLETTVKYNSSNKYNSLIYTYNFKNNINKFEIIESVSNFDINKIKQNEIIVEKSSYYLIDVELGNYLEINNEEYKIVAIADNMLYYNKEAEKSLIDNKTYELIAYKNEDNLNYFSNIFITFDKRNISDQFSKKYINSLEKKTTYLEDDVLELILNDRKQNIKDKYPYITDEMLKDLNVFILDRNSNISFQTFKSLINTVDQITSIFPIFFLLVSALVVLTTMSRMIEEERQQVGILRSIGYSKSSIYFKYMFYALIIGLLGTTLGYAAGFRLIPSIIKNAFETVFYVAPLNLDIYSLSNMIYILVIIFSILIVSIFSVRKTLNQTSSELLMPRAPKFGKRIILEKINFIWKRLKFKYKSTLINLFRYPKHFIMAVLGVMGSLALVFTGISLTSAVDAITIKQYEEIFKYDYELILKDYEETDLFNYLTDNDIKYLKVLEYGKLLKTKRTNENFFITVKIIDGDINDFITLKGRKEKDNEKLTNNGIIITEQISYYLEKDINDKFKIDEDNEVLITGITENYMENFIYMTKDFYNTLNSKDLSYKVLIKNQDINLSKIKEFSSYNNHIDLKEQTQEKNRQLNQVKLLAIVIVLAAIFLQVIIIYNLMNVNISERDKELSTLKVLGYTNYEVSSYIFREINIMTGIGIILGVPIGIALQRFVILSVDEPNTMLGRNFGWYSFVSSILLTIIMTIIVEIIMHFKIKKIDMISALKEL